MGGMLNESNQSVNNRTPAFCNPYSVLVIILKHIELKKGLHNFYAFTSCILLQIANLAIGTNLRYNIFRRKIAFNRNDLFGGFQSEG